MPLPRSGCLRHPSTAASGRDFFSFFLSFRWNSQIVLSGHRRNSLKTAYKALYGSLIGKEI